LKNKVTVLIAISDNTKRTYIIMCKFNISNEKKNRNSGLKWANYSSNISWGREKDGEKKKMSKVSFCF